MRNSPPEAGQLKRYGLALACVLAAFLLIYASWPFLKPTSWAPFIVAVMVSAWFGGYGPSLFAVAASAVLGQYFLFEPYGSFHPGGNSVFRTLVFLVLSTFVAFLISSKRRAERVERAERMRFQATVTSIGDAVIATDNQGRISFMNGVAEKLTAWSGTDAKGRPLEDIFVIANEGTRATVANPVQKVLETGRIQGLANHTILIARDGTERPIDDSAAPIKDDRGELMGVVLTFRDVSEQRSAARALAESEDYSRRIIESNSDCLKVIDLDGRLQLMNENGCRLMEIDDFAPFAGQTWSELWPVGSRELANGALKAARAGQVAHFEGLCPTAKGTLKWWDVAVSPVLDGSGALVRFLSVSRDITERKHHELALKEANDRSEAVARATNDAVWDWDMATDEVRWNQAITKLFGYEPSEVGKDSAWWWDRIHPEDRERVVTTIHDVIEYGGSTWRGEYRFRRTDGSYAFVLDRGYAIYDASGKTARIVGAMLDLTEHHRLLKEVETERERLAEVFQRAPSFMCVLRGPEHVFERMNDRYYQLVGHRDLLGKAVREALPEVEGQGFFELLDKVYRSGEAFIGSDMPVMLQRKPDDRPEERFIDLLYQVLRNSEGTITGVLAQGIDQTDRKRAEEEVRSKTERINLLVENIKDYAVLITDVEGTIVEWQGGAERITGFAAEEAIGKKTHLIFTPEDRAAGMPEMELAKVVETGRAEDKRWHLRRDGSRFFADGVMVALLDGGGRRRGYGRVFRDATGEREAEEATKRRASQLQKLADIANRINSAHDVQSVLGVVTGEARALLDAHQAATSMVAHPQQPEPLVIVSNSAKHPHGSNPPVLDGLDMYGAEGMADEPIRLSRGELDADPRWQAIGKSSSLAETANGWIAAPLVGRSGKSMGLIQLSSKFEGEFTTEDEAVLVQLSKLAAIAIENARLYHELRANDERKDEFLAMLAHELRNPLAAISNAVKLSAKTELKDHHEWSMGVITRQMLHLSRLIDDLMDVSRITRGKIELRREVLDATPILESAAATVKTLVDERKHTLDIDVEEGPLWVHVDPTRLEQVVVNLLNNAAKYSENSGNIRLTARREGEQVVIGIKDKGVGIPPERLPEMFELFAQGDRSLARSEGGLGIGLTVVKKLVEMHGGTITAASEGPGRGSEFTIRLPLARKSRAEQLPARPSVEVPVKKARILVVDDNVDTARGMSRLMKLIGHDVATAHNGHEAVEVAKEFHPDFILLDIGLPGMSGYEVAAKLRQESSCKDALIVAISGYGQDEDRRRSRDAGFDYHLTKPLDHDALLTLLSAASNGEG